MVVIKTEFVELPEYCEACCYFGSRPHLFVDSVNLVDDEKAARHE